MASYPDSIAHPSGAQLALVPEMVLVKVVPGRAASTSDVLDEAGLVPLQSGPTADSSARSVPGTDLPHAVVNESADLRFASARDGRSVDRDVVAASSGVEWTAPVYRAEVRGHEEMLAPLANSLIIPSAVAEDQSAKPVLEEYGLVRNDARSALLGPFDVYEISSENPAAYDIRDELSARLGAEVRLEFVPLVTPVAFQPDDPLFAQQWDMVQIGAGGGGTTAWDVQQGSATITVAVLDEGVDLGHPDLVGAFLNNGINLGSMSGTGAPTGNHGTPCAGIASAPLNNSTGTAGVGGGALILPLAFQNWTDVEVAAGIRHATGQGARVISMSFGWDLWDHAVIDPAITEAHDAGLVMCVATHNHNTENGVTYPATNPLVMAIGASDQADNRKSPSSPDGEGWGSNWGPEVSVVAPGVLCPAPDRSGSDGYTGDDYTMTFNGTSAATPHVAGLAALILSRNPSLTNTEVRAIIETTAARVGTVPYAETPGHANGTWNAEMGHGRIDANAAILATPAVVAHAQDNAIALVRQTPGWGTIPVAFARGDGNWDITNGAAATFIGSWANTPGVQVVTGDFNGNGLTDIALVRQLAGWGTIPVAFARGDGNWDITNGGAPNFIGAWANTPGVRVVTGDFNGNGLTDIALVRQQAGWGTIPVAFARGDGNWDITNGGAP
ncbi:S8 family serine peptidase, partial [Microbacterium sp. DT81.1]|uniref:S8 family serine peptidase n=1 Tax=Microbacterium sp. DT81.1 TaxID=3393413 RepID=UPI003CF40E03